MDLDITADFPQSRFGIILGRDDLIYWHQVCRKRGEDGVSSIVSRTKKVAFVAQPEYFQCHYGGDLDNLYDVVSFRMTFSGRPEDFRAVMEFDADINVFFRGEFVPDPVLESLSGIRVNLSTEPFPKLLDEEFIYTSDSISRVKTFLGIVDKKFDYIFHYDEASREFLEKQGIHLSGYFPLPIAIQTYRPLDIAKEHDLFFIGRSTEHRERFFGPLKRDFDFLHIAHGITGQKLLPYLSSARFAVNVHAEDELSWEPRIQLSLACGTLMVSEPISPNTIIRPGREFIEVQTPSELYEVGREIISNPEAFESIRLSGFERVRQYLSADKAFQALFEGLTNGNFERPVFEKKRLRLEPLELCAQYNGFDHILDELKNRHA